MAVFFDNLWENCKKRIQREHGEENKGKLSDEEVEKFFKFPLWKWKISQCEYDALKNYLYNEIKWYQDLVFPSDKDKIRLTDNIGCEVVLYYSEYWRREYNGESRKEESAFLALGFSENTIDSELFSLFKNSAKRGYPSQGNPRVRSGWKRIGLKEGADIFTSARGDGTQVKRLEHSLLYQGGMPMQCILNGQRHWGQFIDKLLSDKVNYDELDMGVIANEVCGPRDFCQQLKYAFEMNREAFTLGFQSLMKPELMPFHCESHTDNWFVSVMEKCLVTESEHESHGSIPFQLKWIAYCKDERAEFYYCITTASRLSDNYVLVHNLQNSGSQSFILQEGETSNLFRTFTENDRGQLVANTVQDFYAPYNGDKVVSIISQENGEILLQRDMSLTRPIMSVHEGEGHYRILQGNSLDRVGSCAIRLFLPADWKMISHIEGSSECTRKCNNGQIPDMRLVFIPAGSHASGIQVRNEQTGEIITYAPNIVQQELLVNDSSFGKGSRYWATDKQLLYTSEHGYFTLKTNESEETISKDKLEFCSYENSTIWQKQMPTGRIMARYPNGVGGFVYSERFINISGIKIRSLNETGETCEMEIDFPPFVVTVEGGALLPNYLSEDGLRRTHWSIDREQLADKRSICINFLHMDTHRSFSLSFMAPFRECSIYNSLGNRLERFDNIPISDFSAFTYRITNQNNNFAIHMEDGAQVRRFAVSNNRGILTCTNLDDRNNKWTAPEEGSLSVLFNPILNGYEPKSFTVGYADKPHPFFHFKVCPHPYFPIRKNNHFTISCENPFRQDENGNNLHYDIKYKAPLVLLDATDISAKPIVLEYQEGGHIIADEDMGKGRSYIVVGMLPGHITPRFEDLAQTEETPQDVRVRNFESNIARINEAFSHSRLFDGQSQAAHYWFRQSETYQVDATYFLDLKQLTLQPRYVAMLLSIRLLDSKDEEGNKLLCKQFLKRFAAPEGNVMNHPLIQAMTNTVIESLHPTADNIDQLIDTTTDFYQFYYKQWLMNQPEGTDTSDLAFAAQMWQKLKSFSENYMRYAQ